MPVSLGSNHFEGTIPTAIGNLTNLYHLGFGKTKVYALSHRFCCWCSSFDIEFDKVYQMLNVSGPLVLMLGSSGYKGFVGTIPTEIGMLSKLTILAFGKLKDV